MLTADEEAALHVRIATGDTAARWELVLAFEPLSRKLAWCSSDRLSVDVDTLEGVAQDAVYIAAGAWDPVRGRFSRYAWRCVVTALHRYAGQARRRREAESVPTGEARPGDISAAIDTLRACQRVAAALACLPADERAVIRERIMADDTKSLRQCQDAMGISYVSVLRAERRAMAVLTCACVTDDD